MPDTFTCSLCDQTFEKGWSDEEAEKELKENFNVPKEKCKIVCDDCYKRLPQCRS